MNYQNSITFAAKLDEEDPLKGFRKLFHIPKHKGGEAIYFCGNSLGLQPKSAQQHVNAIFNTWGEVGIEGFFQGDEPWLNYHKGLTKTLAGIVGAKSEEVTVMNSLTVNIHLLMVSFYKPTGNRFKILMEGGAFPSDQYAMESQARFHGYGPKEAIIEVFPRKGEYTLRTADIIQKIEEHADQLALVLFGGINYFTGQLFDMEAITKAAHKAGVYAGFDLAHAAGNVPLKLHDWDVDFAAWCSYKYMNSGPGGISGIFVNEKHFDDKTLNRFSGWWGYREDQRFLMAPGFVPEHGAAGWQLSTSPMMLLALHKAALEIFEQAGGINPLREKSELLTGYLEFLISEINREKGEEFFKVITPKNAAERGCQLSIICKENARAIFDFLTENGVIGDWREPNVIRLSPVPLYNTFGEIFEVGRILASWVNKS
jgi:kynureninase